MMLAAYMYDISVGEALQVQMVSRIDGSNLLMARALLYVAILAHKLWMLSVFQLRDFAEAIIAQFLPIRPMYYQIGVVYGELRFFRTQGNGTVVGFTLCSRLALTLEIFEDASTHARHSGTHCDAVPLL